MRRSAPFLLISLLSLPVGVARADGPHIAFHAPEGPYDVTVFSAPDPLVTGPVELVLLVQDSSGSLLRNVAASATLHMAGQAAIPVNFRLGGAANPGLPGVAVHVPAAGMWKMDMHLASPGGAPTEFPVALPVAVNHGSRNTVLWAVFLLGAAILLFLANQQGKAKLRVRRAHL